MRCALASLGFINEDLKYNKEVIIDTMIECSEKADVVIFGEAFLQGFYGLNFNEKHDAEIAISLGDEIIREICQVAKQYAIGVSFGFIEKTEDSFYSSQIIIDKNGCVIDLYRRVSPGWKEKIASEKYREGKEFSAFYFEGKRIVIGLCGDLWYDENVDKVKGLNPDVVFWPVYTDFNFNEWNTSIKFEYAEQASKFCDVALYVNSFCKDKDGDEIARGGAACFKNGEVYKDAPAGDEKILFVEV